MIRGFPRVRVDEAALGAVEEPALGDEPEGLPALVGHREARALLGLPSGTSDQRVALETKAERVEEIGHERDGGVGYGAIRRVADDLPRPLEALLNRRALGGRAAVRRQRGVVAIVDGRS